ncbi:MAG: phenylalanine--tRNA ligase subunit beta, partial [Candidatus Dojkabacteria bacterium]|nr:phenylalanine--tRNA ligase subunit beta [Candidatus Dojkabacteria bacterium]
MKLPISSIKDFSDISIELDGLLHILASKIGEVEGYSDWSEIYKGLYIAQIVSKDDHPDADKLSVYKITIKEGEDIQVVAGDKTLDIGDKVVYIKPGNIVPLTYKTSDEFVIKAVKMRGILSNGMLCSEKELNIGVDNAKVMRLDSDATVGDTFIKYFDFNDTVIEIENKALTNRGDLFGILGLVREITAAKGVQFHSPEWYTDYKMPSIEKEDLLSLKIDNQAHNLCSRYIGVVMDNITVKESPVWLKSILIKSGIRPINNIVDITNYLSILVGQPLHAFDYDKVLNKDPKKEAHITIRLAKAGESIHTLDSNLVELNSNTLVIADSTNPIAIAGVIGGLDTEIDRNTKRVILECANFDRFNIRKTSMSLGIVTDAVTRFTKSLDPNQCLPTLKHAISLIEQICEGKLSSEVVDIYPEISLPKKVSLSISRVNTHLGVTLSKEEVSTILKNLEYTVHESKKEDDFLTVTAPTFRTDITIPEDIHEDIGRIYGYENIDPVFPQRDVRATRRNKNIILKSKIRSILSNSG